MSESRVLAILARMLEEEMRPMVEELHKTTEAKTSCT